jgi:predicted permease
MNLRIVFSRVAALFRARSLDHDLDEELRAHLDLLIEENTARGMHRDEARRAALRRLGNLDHLKESYRDERGLPWIETVARDVRYALRVLARKPSFAAAAILTLALGIGANTAVFSLINTVLLRPLPVDHPERVFDVNPVRKNSIFSNFSYPLYVDVRDQNQVLDGFAAYRFAPMSLSRGGGNERIWGYLVSGNYFDVLGVRASRGRTFTPEEDRAPGKNPVAIVSYGSWQRRFGGDPGLVGREIRLNGHTFTVVGIAPEKFTGTVLLFTPEVWVPLTMARQIEPGSNWLEERSSGVLFTFGRLRPDATRPAAAEALSALLAGFARAYAYQEGNRVELTPPGLVLPVLRDQTLNFAWALMATMGLVLLIACTNLANLLLARAAGRRKEIAVRLSLGATRRRLVLQLLTESVLLALAGGAAGWLLARWIVELVTSLKPPLDFALTIQLALDWRVLLFTMGMSLATGVLFGLAPALQVTLPDLVPALKDGSFSGSGSSRLRNGLVVAQIAPSLALLVGAGLMVRTLQQVKTVGPGFEVEHIVTASVDLQLQGYDQTRGIEFYKQLVARLESTPGIESASLVNYLPLNLDRNSVSIYIEGAPSPRPGDAPDVQSNAVWPRYFATMGIPILAGRDFTAADSKTESRVAVVNETFARRFWPGQNALGKRLRRGSPQGAWWEIVGVVKDGKYWSLQEDAQPFIHFPLLRDYSGSAALLARTTGDPESAIRAIHEEIRQLDPGLPLYDAKTMREHLRLSLFPLRAGAWVAGSFALLAAILSALGIYGVMAYAVSQRTREFGIRMALGARPGDVTSLVVKQGMKLAAIGLALGWIGALALSRLLSRVLAAARTTDWETFAAVTLLLSAAVWLACWFPARRATRVDPLESLRYE